jgi:hypothetical protein
MAVVVRQDVEKCRQLCYFTQGLNVPPMGKESVLAGSWRVGENDYASPFPSLRPRWTAFLNILQVTRPRTSEVGAALLKDVKR